MEDDERYVLTSKFLDLDEFTCASEQAFGHIFHLKQPRGPEAKTQLPEISTP